MSKIRQIESAKLKKTDKTISQAHIGPKWPTFEAVNINSAISSTLVRYHHHCPISNPKRNSWETKKVLDHFPPQKKSVRPPTFPWKKVLIPLVWYLEKTPRPLFFLEKKFSPPYFSLKKTRRPLSSLRNTRRPSFSLKKVVAPFFTWKYLSIHFERSLSKDCAVLGFTSLKEHEYFVQNLILWISWLTVICYKGPVNIHGEYGTGKVATAQLIIFVLQSYGATGYIESRVTGGPKKSENRRYCAIGLGLSNRKREYSEDPSKSLLVMIMHFDVIWIPLKLLH